MNILFTCSAKRWGGNEAWVLNAADALKEHHNVLVAYRNESVGSRFKTMKYRLPFMSEGDLFTLVRLVTIIKKYNIDVIIPTKRKDYVLAGIASRISGIKNVLILGIVRDLRRNTINSLIYNHLADGIMVNARAIKDTLLQSLNIDYDKIAVVPNGLSLNAASFSPAERKTGFGITSIGELSERKGFDFLIRGFALFTEKYGITDASLTIIGEGGQLGTLKTLAASLGIGDMVMFTGFLTNPYPYLLSGSVFALASKNEGIPYVTLEGALLDNAIITTKAGGIEEIFNHGEHCLFVRYNDVDTLAECLLFLYKNPVEREKMAEAARLVVKQKFSIEKMAADMTSFLSRLNSSNSLKTENQSDEQPCR